MRALRFFVFNLLSWVLVVIFTVLVFLARVFGSNASFRVARTWCRIIEWLARHLCGLRYRVVGIENLPDDTFVVLMKHSSAYETYVQNIFLPRVCWVLKRELLFVPFFGWALLALRAIAIDRGKGRHAVKQVMEQGIERLNDGINVSVFPEGTRMPPGETRRYGKSGTLLAQAAGKLIVPVAHNSAYHWPRRANKIVPGIVTFVVGKPIDPAGREPDVVNAEIQQWIEAEVARLQAEGE